MRLAEISQCSAAGTRPARARPARAANGLSASARAIPAARNGAVATY